MLLPATIYGEEDGHLDDLGGRRREFRAAVTPAGEARLPRDVATALAARWAEVEPRLPEPRAEAHGEVRGGPALGRPAGSLWVVREPSGYVLRGHDLTVQVPGLIPLARPGQMLVHPADALDLGLKSGDAVALLNGPATPVTEAVVAVDAEAEQGLARLALPPSAWPLTGENPSLLTIRPVLRVAQPITTSRG